MRPACVATVTAFAAAVAGILAARHPEYPGQDILSHEAIDPLRQANHLLPARRPNIVFILTDDQDVHLDSLDYMPKVREHLLAQGTSFTKHYCTTAVCCPSRVTLWTGKAAHNTNITDVNPPYGGYPRFVDQGFNEKYLPVWLQEAGYNTYYTGKLFNFHTVWNFRTPIAKGWNGTDFLLDPYTYDYLNSSFSYDFQDPRSFEGQYVTDVLAEKAYHLLDRAANDEKRPFFFTIAPSAPHANIVMSGNITDPEVKLTFGPPVSAKRHEHLFEDEKVPRSKKFNPDKPSGAHWVLDLEKQSEENVDWNDHFYRQRLRSLQAVDELVEGIVRRLERYGLLDNTYIVYSSDNGFHIGQHRLQPGKSCGFEEDINIPLIVRGPGVATNATTNLVTTHTDLAPTFFQLMGIPLRDDFDGVAFPVTPAELEVARRRRREHVNVEYWGFAGGEGKYDHDILHQNNTYKAIRILGPGYNLYYSIWCTNEHELYDMDHDPDQMHNLLAHPFSPASGSSSSVHRIAGLPVPKVVARLDSLLLVLKSCTGKVCREPWQNLHPDGDVLTLEDALAPRFDDFYEVQQTRVAYDFCWNGYWKEAEGPSWETEGLMFRHGIPSQEWT